MTVEEERQAISQLDVDSQVVVESSRSGGQKKSLRPRKRRCRVSSKPRHNSKTCQVVIHTSGKEYSN